ncbi:MAG: nucleotidyl transferase AbiEii/AbiGii toxin family protein [Elusimicrobia bacterium]|nr:nucleotidyl transferase AbiEii/AbiGii toxin family protein [Elusimicrobiota bacterium]
MGSKQIKKYETAVAFRQALEIRLKTISDKDKIPQERLRKWVSFDRFLARFFSTQNPKWILKGGYAMELRFQMVARATRDIDFSIANFKQPTSEKIRDLLIEDSAKDLHDWFHFRIGLPMLELDALYGGWRYPVTVIVDERTFSKFHVDIGIGDALISNPEWKEGNKILDFAGIPPARIALLPIEQQFAEKLHAYTLPRVRKNSRVRDLVDMVLLIEQGIPKISTVAHAIEYNFKRRKTHSIPTVLNAPPDDWEEGYREMAESIKLSKNTMSSAFSVLKEFWKKLEPELKKMHE